MKIRRLIFLVVLTLLPLPVAAQHVALPQPPPPSPILASQLYLANPVTPDRLQAINPATLADRAGSLNLGWNTAETWLASRDGKTLVSIAGAMLVTVYDPQTGRQRAQFLTPVFMGQPQLTADGTKIVATTGNFAAPAWSIFDLATGRVEQTIHCPAPGRQLSWLSPDGRRLYLLTIHQENYVTESDRNVSGPWPTQLDAYNLTTGQQIGQLTLPQVQGGSWQTPATGTTEPVIHTIDPGGALSPDGKTLALIDPRSQTLVFIDTATLQVTRTLPIRQPVSLAHRLLAALGLAPQSAAAKELATLTSRQLVFSADGHRLYVTGVTGLDTGLGPENKPQQHDLGLQAIDPASGRVAAAIFAGETIAWMLPAPDGSGLYVEAQKHPGAQVIDSEQFTVFRLAPDSLEPLASRAFDLSVQAVIAPAVA